MASSGDKLSSTIIFYDLVAYPGGPYFSPATLRARLAFRMKGVPIQVQDLTYSELRRDWCGADKPLGLNDVTVPFIRLPDGAFMMDSEAIIAWLDKTYPDRTNIYQPEAPLPVDCASELYTNALETFRAKEWNTEGLFVPYAPKLVETMNQADRDYFTSDSRLGNGGWQRIMNVYKDKDRMEREARASIEGARTSMFRGGFLASASKPGMLDLTLFGRYHMVRSTNPPFAKQVFDRELAGWVERMYTFFGDSLKAVSQRDPPIDGSPA